ncbi:uncharacterized protein LOC127750013 isoform X2 [Frankliniella occidentalis]|uniref:Uncharacterized protein LOC127750013 isoform X1 n=1 Tax=Frankliniella occidentalis TaxID=133901 RepID=A0A9C6U508_FRAOC|nr:uncharacterized protein LOC127750013 isoform X1 [Frankliniella occidentalis]XP_052126356.1 uncharacterized protein LOC127750013 isoform X2 [Frankliniella occidentalis]
MSATLWHRVSTGQAVVWIGPSFHLWEDPDYVPLAVYDRDYADWVVDADAPWDSVAVAPSPLPCPPSPGSSPDQGCIGSPSQSSEGGSLTTAAASPATSGRSSSGPSEVWSTPSPGRTRQPQDDSGVGAMSSFLCTPTQPGRPGLAMSVSSSSPSSSPPRNEPLSPCGPPCLLPWDCACFENPGILYARPAAARRTPSGRPTWSTARKKSWRRPTPPPRSRPTGWRRKTPGRRKPRRPNAWSS